MSLIERLATRWEGLDHPFLIHSTGELSFTDLVSHPAMDLSAVRSGDVVALVGDFEPRSISTLLRLIDIGAIVVPLTRDTVEQHAYFFESALVDVSIDEGVLVRHVHGRTHAMIDRLRQLRHAGLVLFSTGTTGRPKAILHDMSLFLQRFDTPRPTLRTLSFLLFDHIGGVNTLLHTLFNAGVVIAPESRSVESVLASCRRYAVEVLPATPTFLRMMLISGALPDGVPPSLRVITYGTERMDQFTLSELCRLLPQVDFRQTFGMSELGIVRVKSRARDSLYMKIGGEGVETSVVDGMLHIRSRSRMLGYLNAPSPFTDDGWYATNDLVDEEDGYYRVVGRVSEAINVGGLKFMASEVELVALAYPGVAHVKVTPRKNPITGQHVELSVQPESERDFDLKAYRAHLKGQLPPHMRPRKVTVGNIPIGHRFKRS